MLEKASGLVLAPRDPAIEKPKKKLRTVLLVIVYREETLEVLQMSRTVFLTLSDLLS
jgi:hypothetical protein